MTKCILFCQVLQQTLCLSTHFREHAHGAVDNDPEEDDYGRKDREKQRLRTKTVGYFYGFVIHA
jgi:hypothetical protein